MTSEIEEQVTQLARTMRNLFNGKPVPTEKAKEQTEVRETAGVLVLQESQHRTL